MPFITISQWAKIRDSRVMKKLFYNISSNPSSYSILKLKANSLTLQWTFVSQLLLVVGQVILELISLLWKHINCLAAAPKKRLLAPKSEWRELILSFPHTYSYSTYLSIGNGRKKHTHNHYYTLETARSIFCRLMTRLPLSLRRGAKSACRAPFALWLLTSEKWAVTLRTANWHAVHLDHIFF